MNINAAISSNPVMPEWLSQLEQRHPASIHPGLERIRQVAERLELTRCDCPVITVAGTNGKGSAVYLLEQIYAGAGYQVGSYTSPHLLFFNERFRINTHTVPDEALMQAYAVIEKASEDIFLSYFEICTLMALYCFKQQALDIIILEVGMGGRLDAANIIDADLCLITSIAFDHQQWLGHSLEEIAGEKAGILRQGKPLVYGSNIMYSSVLEKVRQLKCPLFCRDQEFGRETVSNTYYFSGKSLTISEQCSMHPDAVANVLMVLEYFQPVFPVSYSLIQNICKRTSLTARQQVLQSKCQMVLDVAHNAQAAASLRNKVRGLKVPGKIYVVFSALSDKNHRELVCPLADIADSWHISMLECARATDTFLLETEIRSQTGLPVHKYGTIEEAFGMVWANCRESDLIVVYGSFYTVAAVLNSALYKEIMGEANEVFYG